MLTFVPCVEQIVEKSGPPAPNWDRWKKKKRIRGVSVWIQIKSVYNGKNIKWKSLTNTSQFTFIVTLKLIIKTKNGASRWKYVPHQQGATRFDLFLTFRRSKPWVYPKSWLKVDLKVDFSEVNFKVSFLFQLTNGFESWLILLTNEVKNKVNFMRSQL